jgi:3-hydroxyisobutyrate dehydrogenase
MKIGFIGLGHMGAPMARNLLKAGHQLVVYDVVKDAVEKIVAAGAAASASPSAVAASGVEVLITMLPSSPHVHSVYIGQQSVLAGARPGTLLIDCSTIDVESARAVADQAKAKGFRFADAPVSGGQAGAEAGTLAFMVGCDEADFAAVEAVIQPMARAIIRAGDHGAGQAAKICNNMVLGASMIVVSEAFLLAEKLGLDAQKLFDIASKARTIRATTAAGTDITGQMNPSYRWLKTLSIHRGRFPK